MTASSPIPTRPRTLTDEQRMAVATEVARDLQKVGQLDGMSVEQAANDIFREMAVTAWQDGYEIAKDLERRHCWPVDAHTVEVLDSIGSLAHAAIRKAQQVWAEEHDVKPPYPIGTHVTFRDEAGEITGVYEFGAAQYLVRMDNQPETDTSRRIVNFEDVTPSAVLSAHGSTTS